MENPLNMGLASFCCYISFSGAQASSAPQALIAITARAQEGHAPVWPGTCGVLPPALCETLSPFRSVPLSATSRGGYEACTLHERIASPGLTGPDPAAVMGEASRSRLTL